ncbi:MAG: hypothetical protein IJP17_02165 [Clostridia bacterium]|nr:hypothetical protein [Clostridia bacterium]
MKKIPKFAELSYLLGLILLSLGAAMTAKSDFGVSMIVAPAYMISCKVDFLTFGMAEYLIQALLLAAMCIVMRRFRISYLFSFVTAMLYGAVLDFWVWALGGIPDDTLLARIALYIAGLLLTTLGVSFFFHSYIPPESYDLFVREVSAHFGKDINIFKRWYDAASLAVAILLSLALFGTVSSQYGLGIGTVICTLLNGWLIGLFSRIIEKYFDFSPALDKLYRVVERY